MTKAPTSTEKSKKNQQSDNTKRHQNFDYTTIADRIRTVIWNTKSHPTGVVKVLFKTAFKSFNTPINTVLKRPRSKSNLLRDGKQHGGGVAHASFCSSANRFCTVFLSFVSAYILTYLYILCILVISRTLDTG